MPDTYTSQFSGEEIDAALRAAHIISGASTPAELRDKLEIRGDTIPVSAEDSTLISEALTKIPTTSGGGVNPNLLDNWYFGRPVNQRGQTEYTTTGYTVDRWKLDVGGAVTLEDGCICLKKSGTYWGEYFADFDQFIGMTLTGSVLLSDGTLRTGSFVYNGSVNQAQTFFSSELGFYIQKLSNSQTQCEINSLVDNVKIKAIKLELGDTQTLAHKENGVWVLNEIPDFGEQLRRCTYYAEKVESADTPTITNSTFVPSGATSAVFILPYARKRTVPAINFNDVSNYRIIARSISGGTTAFSATAISLLDVSRTKAAILVSFNATDQGYYCFLQRSDNAPAGYAFISADL